MMRIECDLNLHIARVTTRSTDVKITTSLMHVSNFEVIGWSV